MASKIVFVDSINLRLDEYARGRNELTLQGIDPGYRSMSKIQLVYLKIPTYLLDDNSVRITMNVGDSDDKSEVSKENDIYYVASYFARVENIVPSVNMFKTDWYRHEQILPDTRYSMQNGSTIEEGGFVVFENESVLNSMTLATGSDTLRMTITFSPFGGIQFSGGAVDETYSFFPGILYEFVIDGSIQMITNDSVELNNDEKVTLFNSLTENNGEFILSIPRGELKNTTFKLKFINANGVEVIREYGLYTTAGDSYEFELRKNSSLVYKTNILMKHNEKVNKYDMRPFFTNQDTTPPFYDGVRQLFYPQNFELFERASSLEYSLKRANNTYAFDTLSLQGLKHPGGTRTINNLYSSVLFVKREFAQIKMNDLLYTRPTNTNKLPSAYSVTLKFFDRSGNPYPIFNKNDIVLGLEFFKDEE